MNKEKALKELEDKWSVCEKCPLHKTRKNVVFGEGNPNADLLFVGGGPGKEEDISGRPFRGDAGIVLHQFLQGAKLSLKNDIYLTNIVCCYPQIEKEDERTGKKFMSYREPNKIERIACRERLLETIYIIDPLLIVTFGRIALQALTGKGTVTARTRGEVQVMHLPGRRTELRYAVFPMHDLASLASSSNRTQSTGPWRPTEEDFGTICNALDFLREKYYGILPPDVEQQKQQDQDFEEELDEEDRTD